MSACVVVRSVRRARSFWAVVHLQTRAKLSQTVKRERCRVFRDLMRSDEGRTCINDTERVSARRRDRSSLSFLACSSKDARSTLSLDAPPRATRFAVLNDPSNIFPESQRMGLGRNPTGRPANEHSWHGFQVTPVLRVEVPPPRARLARPAPRKPERAPLPG